MHFALEITSYMHMYIILQISHDFVGNFNIHNCVCSGDFILNR